LNPSPPSPTLPVNPTVDDNDAKALVGKAKTWNKLKGATLMVPKGSEKDMKKVDETADIPSIGDNYTDSDIGAVETSSNDPNNSINNSTNNSGSINNSSNFYEGKDKARFSSTPTLGNIAASLSVKSVSAGGKRQPLTTSSPLVQVLLPLHVGPPLPQSPPASVYAKTVITSSDAELLNRNATSIAESINIFKNHLLDIDKDMKVDIEKRDILVTNLQSLVFKKEALEKRVKEKELWLSTYSKNIQPVEDHFNDLYEKVGQIRSSLNNPVK